jgi:hypothetical protein
MMPEPPLLAEDLLLLLFQPDAGPRTPDVRAGQSTLPHALAGAVLADLGLGGHVRIIPGRGGAKRVEAVVQRPPADDILLFAWDFLAVRPREVHAAIAAIGPDLRSLLLDRLVRRGDIHRSVRTALGVLDVEVLVDGGTGRRAALLSAVRAVLVDGAEPQPRVAALAALLSGSGTLAQFGPGIPWDAAVVARAKTLEHESWGATAAAEAIARTVTAAIVSNVVVAASVLPEPSGPPPA